MARSTFFKTRPFGVWLTWFFPDHEGFKSHSDMILPDDLKELRLISVILTYGPKPNAEPLGRFSAGRLEQKISVPEGVQKEMRSA